MIASWRMHGVPSIRGRALEPQWLSHLLEPRSYGLAMPSAQLLSLLHC